jgi:thiol-disulfide isomerase/thioredoxin
MHVFNRMDTPSLAGATGWLNSEPLGLPELRGHVVLVNFWTLTCINWLRTEPYVRAWSRAYAHDGLVVVGVHTPEFSFEHDVGLVQQAVRDRDIGYPVATDNDFAVWSSFDNHYWPALYFLDQEGHIRDSHFGEGRYATSERSIQKLLGVERALTSVRGVGVEAEADWHHLRSPETYLGYGRGNPPSSPGGAVVDQPRTYELPNRLRRNHWALVGDWTVGSESVVLDRPGGSIACRFHARDANLVMTSEANEPIPFRVRLEGAAPGSSHGVDVDDTGDGVLREGRMYQLVRQQDGVRGRTVEVTFLDAGAAAFSFTFG